MADVPSRVLESRMLSFVFVGTALCAGAQTACAPGPAQEATAAARSALITTPATYGGGAVISPEIVTLYWGTFPQAQIDGMQTYLRNLAIHMRGDTAPPGQEPVTFQYGVYGATVGATFSDTSVPNNGGVPGHAIVNFVLPRILAMQSAGHLPAFSPQRVFMVFTQGITFDDNYAGLSGWCGQHLASGLGRYYAVVPFPTAHCADSGVPSAVWQGIASHEVFESAANPAAVTTGVAGAGWTPDIGDDQQCNSAWVALPFGSVQPVVDNLHGTCSIWTKQQYSQTSVVSWGPGRLDVFALAVDRTYGHNTFITGTGWSGWESHGGVFVGPPVVTSWGTNELDVFGQSTDGQYQYQHWTGSAWQPSLTTWTPHGGNFIGPPTVVSWGANRIDVFGRGTDGALYHQYYDGTTWRPSVTGWESLGGVLIGKPAVTSWGPNRLDVFAQGTDGAYHHKDWNGSAWEPSMIDWESHGGRFIRPPVTFSWGANELDVFGVSTDSALYHQHFNGSVWQPSTTNWSGHGGNLVGQVAAATWGTNRLDLYAQGTNDQYYHQFWDGTTWQPTLTDWEAHGGNFISGPALASWGVNTLATFGTDASSGSLFVQSWQGFWSPSQTTWASLGGAIH